MVTKNFAKVSKDEFIEKGKLQRQTKPNIPKRRSGNKIMQTMYLSEDIVKLLWQHRVDTRESISATVERLVLKNLKKK